MKISTISKYIFLAFTLAFFNSCNDDDNDNAQDVTEAGTISLNFSNVIGTSDLELDTDFTAASGDEITFTRFQYIISNVTLIGEDGSTYLIPDSYYIFGQASDTSALKEDIEIADIPAGSYTGIQFSIGVDPTTNANTDTYEKGDLQGGLGLDWGWATGYKFINWEGSYFNTSTNEDVDFRFHIGTDDNYRTFEQDFPQVITINGEMTTDIMFEVQANDIFEAVGLNDLGVNLPATDATFTGVMFSPTDKATLIADAYANMFTLHHVMNSSAE